MQKRGQVTTFVIIGILLVVIIILVFAFKDYLISGINSDPSKSLNVQKQMEVKMASISEKIESCVQDIGMETLVDMSERGGFFETIDYKRYQGKDISILCKKIKEDDYCLNVVPPNNVLEKQFSDVLKDRLGGCMQIQKFGSDDMKISTGGLLVETEIGKNVVVELDYAVTLEKDEQKYGQNKFVYIINYPLEEFLDITRDIVGDHAIGEFDFVEQVANTPGWIIDPRDVGSNRIYRLADFHENYEFWFVVEK